MKQCKCFVNLYFPSFIVTVTFKFGYIIRLDGASTLNSVISQS